MELTLQKFLIPAFKEFVGELLSFPSISLKEVFDIINFRVRLDSPNNRVEADVVPVVFFLEVLPRTLHDYRHPFSKGVSPSKFILETVPLPGYRLEKVTLFFPLHDVVRIEALFTHLTTVFSNAVVASLELDRLG